MIRSRKRLNWGTVDGTQKASALPTYDFSATAGTSLLRTLLDGLMISAATELNKEWK
jgi:hypothetical protein